MARVVHFEDNGGNPAAGNRILIARSLAGSLTIGRDREIIGWSRQGRGASQISNWQCFFFFFEVFDDVLLAHRRNSHREIVRAQGARMELESPATTRYYRRQHQEPGQLVEVRRRQWIVSDVDASAVSPELPKRQPRQARVHRRGRARRGDRGPLGARAGRSRHRTRRPADDDRPRRSRRSSTPSSTPSAGAPRPTPTAATSRRPSAAASASRTTSSTRSCARSTWRAPTC